MLAPRPNVEDNLLFGNYRLMIIQRYLKSNPNEGSYGTGLKTKEAAKYITT